MNRFNTTIIYALKSFFLCFVLFVYSMNTWADVEINETTFPDENFRNWVLANSFGRDGVLTDAEIASVTKLNIGSRRIQSLKGIEFFTETSWLDVGGNDITEIVLSPFPKMTHLDIGWCKITELDLSKNTALTYLDCRGNGLTAIDLSKNTALTTLLCFSNQLTELDVSQNTQLTEIECQNNLLTELDLSNNLVLERLECMENLLTSLDVSQHAVLNYLWCSNNQLASLDVSGCTAIGRLNCCSNQLTELDVKDCTVLSKLYCTNNLLTALDVSKNTKLQELDCKQNKLTELNASGNKELWVLHCNDNHLTELDVSNLSNLYHLHCYRNQLTSLNMSGNTSLINLFCYSNQIKDEAMDALLESMHSIESGDIYGFRVINSEDEHNVMTKAQVEAAKVKGWTPLHHVGGYSWQEYEGSDPVDPVTFTIGQMATIILPTKPDAGKGKYYRLDRAEDGQIVFEQERQPQARVPYIIVPDEDFSIDTETLELAGLSADTVKADGIRFIGTYSREELGSKEGFYIDIIDQTPDCSLSPSEETGKGAVVGALRAYLQVPWDEPYSSGSPRSPQQKMEIVLKDNPNSLTPSPSPRRGEVYDLQGRKIAGNSNSKIQNSKLPRGIYIRDGRKVVEY